MHQRKYKECSPQTTVSNIKTILATHEVIVEEREWWNKEDSRWPKSMALHLKGLPFSVNGKGMDPLFAQASAYGEFMERLQNISMMRSRFRLDARSKFYVKTPDRRDWDAQITQDIRHLRFCGQSVDTVVQSMFEENGVDSPGFGWIKYLDVKRNKIVYLPEELLALCTGSNGMCAGNSIPEALIEGLCEIFERHVLKMIYTAKDIFLPKVAESYLKDFPIWSSINFLKEVGCTVTVHDCSLEGIYPVVGLFVKCQDTLRFNLGSAPDFSLALERCFTEIFQGKSIAKFTNQFMEKTSPVIHRELVKKELMKSFVSYSGSFNEEILSEKTLDHEPFGSLRGVSNDDTLKNLVQILLQRGEDLYIREVSFLGFPAFHIYVPSMSEVIEHSLDDLKMKRNLVLNSSALFELAKSTQENLRLLIYSIEVALQDTARDTDLLAILLRVPNSPSTSQVNIHQVLALLCYYAGDCKKALGYMKGVGENEAANCLREFFVKTAEGRSIFDVRDKVEAFFSKETVDDVIRILEQPGLLSQYLVQIKNEHNPAPVEAFCEKIQKLLDQYSFDQLNLQKYFQNLRMF